MSDGQGRHNENFILFHNNLLSILSLFFYLYRPRVFREILKGYDFRIANIAVFFEDQIQPIILGLDFDR